FPEVLRRIGVQRRLYTAGEEKTLLDPFLAEDQRGIERLKGLQRDIHESFIALVRSRRGSRLKGEEEHLFTGEVFTGRKALACGLIDGIGEVRGVLRQRFGAEVRLRLIEPERRRASLSWLLPQRRPDLSELAADLFGRVEEHLLWSRFGL
ncbi:MAG TPA: S49 family peptidase, partial [Stellaceae bacterium]|nr:S49 family peptidase [Stellaceae bacterium]